MFSIRARLEPRAGQVERIRPTIGRIVASLDQPAPLELVEQHHESAWEHAKLFAERLLAEAVGLPDHPQDARVRWREIEWRQAIRESRGGMSADLREQKRHPGL